MSTGKWIAPFVLASGLIAASTAHARPEGAGFYFGGSGGQSSFDQDREDLDLVVFESFGGAGLPVFNVRGDLDDSDNNFTGFAGYRFNRYVAVEGGYTDLGEITYNASISALNGLSIVPGTMQFTASSKGAFVNGMGIWPITKIWEVYGRGGFYVSDTQVSATARIGSNTSTATESSTSVDAMIGLGTALHLGQHLLVRLEYQRFGAVGDEDTTGETDVDAFNLGLVIRF